MFLSILRAKEIISTDSESTGDDIVGPQPQSPSSTPTPVGSNETIDLNLQKPETPLNSLPSIYKSDVDYGSDLGSTISSDSLKSFASATTSGIGSNRVCPSQTSIPGASNSLISSSDGAEEDLVPESRGRSLTQVSTQSENLFDSSSPPGSPTHSDSEVTVSTEFEPASPPTWQEFCEFPFVPSGTDNLPPTPSPIHRKKSEFRLRYKSLDIKLCLQCEVLDLPCSLYFYRNKDPSCCQQCLRNGEGFCIKQVWSRTYEKTGEKKFEYVTTERISQETLDERAKELLSMKEDKVRFALPMAPVGYRKTLKNAFRYASMTEEIIDAKSEAAKAILVPQDT